MCIEQQRQMLEEMRGIRKALEYLVRQRSPTVPTVRIINKTPRGADRPIRDLDDAARWEPGVYDPSEYDMRDGLPTGEPPENYFFLDSDAEPGYSVETCVDETW